LDGKYLKSVHRQFGKYPLRKWRPEDPGFNLDVSQMFYYAVWKGIKAIPILYYVNYIRSEAEQIIKKEFDWIYPGAHYFDDLYQSMMAYIYRTKFNIDRRKFNYSALVRSGQMTRESALELTKKVYAIEDPQVINLCIKRLGLTREELDEYLAFPPKTFRDYPNHYELICKLKPIIRLLSKLHILPGTAYDKYFNCGE
jgi:hypothetical protein